MFPLLRNVPESLRDKDLGLYLAQRAARVTEKLDEFSPRGAAMALGDITRDGYGGPPNWLVSPYISCPGNCAVRRYISVTSEMAFCQAIKS